MKERLSDLPDLKSKTFIGTIHGFCLEMLTDRGKPVGVMSDAQIFESFSDRKQVLLTAINSDPLLLEDLDDVADDKARNKRIDDWLRTISIAKAHPVTKANAARSIAERLIDAYDSGMRACGAYDFDDLLLLSYKLLTHYPQVADFYRRLYRFICIDEAQDLNEAQYELLRALCGSDFRNVMMVGDPKQSIYGFNTSSPKFLDDFVRDFSASKIELTENYRCSRRVVDAARALIPTYHVSGSCRLKVLLACLLEVTNKTKQLKSSRN